MLLDDRLATVLRYGAQSETGARTQYRQLLDLLGSMQPGTASILIDVAYDRLAELAAELPSTVQSAILRGPGLRLRNAALVAWLAESDPQAAAANSASPARPPQAACFIERQVTTINAERAEFAENRRTRVPACSAASAVHVVFGADSSKTLHYRTRVPGSGAASKPTSAGFPPSGLAARTIPFDSTPINFAGFRLNTTTTVRPTSVSGS